MSLLVWLPLNGNLDNQGLSPATFSAVNSSGGLASVSSGGKTSAGMYKRSKATADYITSDRNFLLDGDFSMCCWAKVTGIGSAQTANGIITQHGHLTGGSGITMKDVSSTDLRMSINTGTDSSNRTYCSYYGTTNIYNQWHHLCVTYDRANQRYRMYVDGKPETIVGVGDYVTFGDNAQPRPFCLFAWSVDHLAYSDYRPPCELNDVRLYDHCLSLKEIKEISKGLIAHYQLKGMGAPNLLKGAGNYNQNNPLIRKVTDSSVHNDSYVYYNGVLSATIPVDGKYTWVLECDGIPSNHATSGTTGSSRRFSMWLQNTSTGNHYCWSDYGIGADGRRYGSVTIPAGTYNVRTNLYAADSVNYTVKMWDIKLVQGGYDPCDKYCPNTEDSQYSSLLLGSMPMQDSSGYKNHLTQVGSIPIIGNSARYSSCVDFNQTGYLKKDDFNMTTDKFTIAFWINAPYSTNNQHFILGTHNNWTNNGFAAWRDANSTSYSTIIRANGTSSWSGLSFYHDTGIWTHIAYVYTGAELVYYKNGIEQGRTTYGSGGTVSHPVLYLGNSLYSGAPASETDEASMSDFRFYATALDAQDVYELATSAASVSKNGAVFTHEFQEGKNSSIDKAGIVTAGGFSDKKVPTYEMKVKALEDGSCWARIHYLDLTNDTTCFQSSAEVDRCLDKNNRYSRIKDLSKYGVSNQYEFMLTYPSIKKTVPAGYTELDYIQTNGTQLIRTGVYGYSDGTYIRGHRWELDIQFEANNIRQLMGYGPYGYEYWGVNSNYYEGTSAPAGKRDTIVHDYSGGTAGGNTLWIDHTQRDVGANLETSYEYTLFGLKWGENTGYFAYAKLYRCKCIRGTSLIRDFVPVQRNSDGAVGLYDTVDGGFYVQSTGNAFTPGYKKGYQELEYIESTGSQYINTGIMCAENNTYQTNLDVLYTTTSPANQIMGFNGHAGMGIGSEGAAFWECSGHGLTANTRYNLEWTKSPGQGIRKINGTTYTVNSNSNGWSGPLLLFAATTSSGDSSINYYCHSRLYSAKIYINNVLSRDLVPVIGEDGRIGMYDKVTKRFFNNRGSGNFIAGPAKQSLPLYNRWTQTGLTEDVNQGDNISFKSISTSWPQHNGPFKPAQSGDTRYDCDNKNTGNWYCPIGQYNIWSGGIPAADSNPVSQTELWVRIDRLAKENQFNIYDSCMTATDYIEI